MVKQYDLNWCGIMTIDNTEEVVNLFKQLLEGKTYTFVVFSEYQQEAKTNQKLCPEKNANGNAINYYSASTYAGFTVCDTSGVWGLSSSSTWKPYISFEYNKVIIEPNIISGYKLWWHIIVEGK